MVYYKEKREGLDIENDLLHKEKEKKNCNMRLKRGKKKGRDIKKRMRIRKKRREKRENKSMKKWI